MRKRVVLGCVLVLAVAVVAWAGDAEKAAEHRQRASAYASEGKDAEAEIELRNVIQLAPRDADAHRALAEVYLRRGNSQGAFREYQEAVSLDPKDGESRIKVATFYLLGKRFEDALSRIREALKLLPDRFEAHAIEARALIGLERLDEALPAMERAVQLGPDHESAWGDLARIHLARKDAAAAEKALRKGLEAIPPSTRLRVLLADFLAARGRFEEADTLMGEVANLAGNDLSLLGKVAAYRLKRGDRDGAEALLVGALEQAGDDAARKKALGILASFYSTTGDLPHARERLEQLRGLAPDDSSVTIRLANLELISDRPEAAAPLVDALLKKSPDDRNVRLLAARLDLARGKVSEGRAALETLVEEEPESVNGNLFLGKAYAMERNWPKARDAYQAVLERSPDHFFANLDLAKVSLQLGRPADALDAIGRVLKTRPNHREARRVRADALLATGKAVKAETIYRALLADGKGSPVLSMRLAQSLEAQGRNEEAVVRYDQARKGAPKALDPVLREMALLDRMNRHDEVNKVGAAYLVTAGEIPPVLNALAVHAISQGDGEAGAAYLNRSLKADPNSVATRELEARVRLSEGDLDAAAVALGHALEQQPDRLTSLLMLANLREEQGNGDAAEKLYERALAADPHNPVAANNLAMIYLHRDEDLSEALRLAQVAVEGAPESPFTLDTLGWVQYRMGSHELARRSLEKAREKLPDNPEVAYHLGMALKAVGEKEKARPLLQKAVDAESKKPWVFDAAQALEELGE